MKSLSINENERAQNVCDIHLRESDTAHFSYEETTQEKRSQIKQLVRQFQNLPLGEILQKVRRRFYSETISYCLRRDLTVPFQPPDAKIPIAIRPLRESDIPVLLDLDRPELSDHEKKELVDRLILLKEGVQACYVAVDQHDIACYMQWLIGSNANEHIQRIYHGGFPWLERDEALLEDAYTPEQRRGLGIMSCAMAQIAERGKDIGARFIITFVWEENIASLKGCKRAGFMPYKLRREKCVFFRRKIEFEMLPENTPYPF